MNSSKDTCLGIIISNFKLKENCDDIDLIKKTLRTRNEKQLEDIPKIIKTGFKVIIYEPFLKCLILFFRKFKKLKILMKILLHYSIRK